MYYNLQLYAQSMEGLECNSSEATFKVRDWIIFTASKNIFFNRVKKKPKIKYKSF